MRNIGRPYFNLKATHQPAATRKKATQDAGGLEPVVRLTERAKAMLRSNMWVSAGLTSDMLGTVAGLLYPPNASGLDTLPTAVCVESAGYQGPALNPERPKMVPVPAITTKWIETAKRKFISWPWHLLSPYKSVRAGRDQPSG